MSLIERTISHNCYLYKHHKCKGIRMINRKIEAKCECDCHEYI